MIKICSIHHDRDKSTSTASRFGLVLSSTDLAVVEQEHMGGGGGGGIPILTAISSISPEEMNHHHQILVLIGHARLIIVLHVDLSIMIQ